MKRLEASVPAGERALRLVAGVAAGTVALHLLATADATTSVALESVLLFAGLVLAVAGAAGRGLLFRRRTQAVAARLPREAAPSMDAEPTRR